MADDARIEAKTSTEVIRLWPDGAPRTIEGVGPETTFRPTDGAAAQTTMLRNVSDATLTVFRPCAGQGQRESA